SHSHLAGTHRADEQALLRLIRMRLTALHFHLIPIRILDRWHEEFRLTLALHLIDKAEGACFALELHLERATGNDASIGTHETFQRAATAVDVGGVFALIDAVDGKIFLIPAIANCLIVPV